MSDRFQVILESALTCQKNVTCTCLPGIMLMNLCEQIKKFMKAGLGKFINRFVNKFQQLNFKKIMQLKMGERN